MPTGIVRSFSAKSGYGFIHSGAVKRAGLKPLYENQRLSYDVRSELDGRRSAIDLKVL